MVLNTNKSKLLGTNASNTSGGDTMNHRTSTFIDGRAVWNLRFTDDMEHIVGGKTELQDMANKLFKKVGAYGMEFNSEKSKVIATSSNYTRVSVTMNHRTSTVIGGRRVWNLRFADDLDLIADGKTELRDLNNKLVERAGAYQMALNTLKSKLLGTNASNTSGSVTMDHRTSTFIGGKPVWKLRFADYIDLVAGGKTDMQDMTNYRAVRAGVYGMELDTVKSKVMATSTSNICGSVTVDVELMEKVPNLKYLEATLSKYGTCNAVVCSRITTARTTTARLERIWLSDISFHTKNKLYKLLVVSILIYGCET